MYTSDIQNDTAIEIVESTVNIHIYCYFVNGSDAQGCLVAFSSNLTQITVQYTESILMENHSTAWSVTSLAHPISCYHKVFALISRLMVMSAT